MDWSWLALLACPLMMIPMMLLMMGGHHRKDATDQAEPHQHATAELSALKEQNNRLRQQLREQKDKD
ncbi:MAG: DUF2933 domain-containing protein [Sporolactobacillus sp.]|jgi:hypothetical protein|nr:DUF2933 domain-containing protein [Sporolactobacillus sp.]MCI1881619.1 DUF2933 domain-containing protein [Sporolactobacillus sp.]